MSQKITLPKTCVDLLRRQFYVWTTEYSDYTVEKMKKNFYKNNGILDSTILKNYQITLSISSDGDDDGDDDDFWLEFEFVVRNKVVFTCKLDDNDEFEEFVDNEDFQFEYELCTCGDIAFENQKCKDCFLFDYEHEDVCSICLENGRKWIELDCGHVFHLSCWKHVLNEKCPLCRGIVKVKTYGYGFH